MWDARNLLIEKIRFSCIASNDRVWLETTAYRQAHHFHWKTGENEGSQGKIREFLEGIKVETRTDLICDLRKGNSVSFEVRSLSNGKGMRNR